MLLPVEIDLISKKRDCKRNSIWLGGSSDDKVVFTLLAEVITLYVRPTTIKVQSLGLEFVSKSIFCDIKKYLNNFVQVLLAILVSIRVLGSRRWS